MAVGPSGAGGQAVLPTWGSSGCGVTGCHLPFPLALGKAGFSDLLSWPFHFAFELNLRCGLETVKANVLIFVAKRTERL